MLGSALSTGYNWDVPEPIRNIDYVRAGVAKASAAFDARIAARGFSHTRKMLWTRHTASSPFTVEFIQFHRTGSTYGSPYNASVDFEVHFGVRVLNDPFPVLALNGPSSEHTPIEDRYHLRFNSKSGSTFERCVDDLVRLVEHYGEPWFRSAASIEALLAPGDPPWYRHPASPDALQPRSAIGTEARDALKRALAGEGSAECERASLKLLGIKGK